MEEESEEDEEEEELSLTSLITSIRLGIVSGWAGGDTRSVKNVALALAPRTLVI